METTVKNVQNGKGEETAACETMELVMESRSENEEFARVVAAVFASRLDPTLEELDDIKTAVSEAVTNAVIHGYRGGKGKITLAATAWEKERLFSVTVRDEGVGIAAFDFPTYLVQSDSQSSSLRHSEFDNLR